MTYTNILMYIVRISVFHYLYIEIFMYFKAFLDLISTVWKNVWTNKFLNLSFLTFKIYHMNLRRSNSNAI